MGTLLAWAAISLAACLTGETDSGASLQVVKIVVTPASVSVSGGAAQPFHAYGVTASGATVNGSFVWTATGGDVSSSGVFTASTAPGSFKVTAANPVWDLTASANVNVIPRLPVRFVTVMPTAVSLAVGGSQRLQVLLQDSLGDTLSGSSLSWTTSNAGVASVDQTGLVTAADTGITTITASTAGHSGTATVTVHGMGSGSWPNEPSGLITRADNGFSALSATGWNLLDNTQGLVTIVADPQAPSSPPSVLQYSYPIGFSDAGPGAEEYELPGLNEIFIGTWWKVSNPWQGHPTDVNKVQIVFTQDGGDLYMVMYGPPGGPYELRVYPQLRGLTPNWLVPNVNQVPVTLGQWHRIEWLLSYNTTTNPPNGIIRWWLDGKLIGDYSNVLFQGGPFADYKVSGIWGGIGGTKTENDFYWYDQVHISGR